jgi:hypothetical protein
MDFRYTGGRQEALSPHRQEPACHRWCFARCDQGAPFAAPRGPCRRPRRRHQGGQGQEDRVRVGEEGQQGQERRLCRKGPGRQDRQQAGRQGRTRQGRRQVPLSSRMLAVDVV